MSDDFDPYYQWMGIPPRQQPPNHYRLLALEEFESNGDVIESAADLRMRHVKSFQNGPQGEVSQRLLNEITAAKLCLLNVEKKAQYDQKLRADKAAAEAAARPTARPVASQHPVAQVEPLDLLGTYTDLGPPMPRPPAATPLAARPLASLPSRAGFPIESPSIDADQDGRRIDVAQLAAIVGGVLGVLVVVMIAMAIGRRTDPTASRQTEAKVAAKTDSQSSSLDQSQVSRTEKSPASSTVPAASSLPETKSKDAGAEPSKLPNPYLAQATAEQIKQAIAKDDLVRTAKIGGNGGGDFSFIPKDGAVLVGTDAYVTAYGGHPIIGGIRFHFLTPEGPWASNLIGGAYEPSFSDRAPPGYAVSGIEARAGHYLDGFRLVYEPIRIPGAPAGEGKRAYGAWRGGDGGGPINITLEGFSAIGIAGKCGQLPDSFGLVGLRDPKGK